MLSLQSLLLCLHNQPPDIIRHKCNIQYFPNLDPEPKILDADKHLLLGNLSLPWTIHCSHNDQILNLIEDSSCVIINKSNLCQCPISAATWYIQENIVYCDEDPDTKINLYYTVNMAVMMFQFKDLMLNRKIADISLFRAHPN